MRKDHELTQEGLDSLLAWLDPNREQSGKKYENIRQGLIKIFTCWGCAEAEDLADETINRVAQKVEAIAKTYTGNPAYYFHGVAKKVHLEYRRRTQKAVALPAHLPGVESLGAADELVYECLEHCLQRLSLPQRELVGRYYLKEAAARSRERMAEQLGLSLSALRVRVFRIVSTLEECVKKCIQRGGV